MQGYLSGQSNYPAHRRARTKPLTFVADLEDGTMVIIVVKGTGEVGIMAFDTEADACVDELHIVGKYDKHGDYEIESLGVMHLEADALIHQIMTDKDVILSNLTIEDEEDNDYLE